MSESSNSKTGVFLGSLSLIIAIPSAFLAFAPFTPAIVTTVLSAPLALTAIVLGAPRTGLLALLWVLATFAGIPNLPHPAETISVGLALLSIALAPVLLLNYRRGQSL